MFEIVKKREPQPDDPWLMRHRVLGFIYSAVLLLLFGYMLFHMR